MKKFLAISLAKLAYKTSRATKRGGGSTLPGLLAQKIDPNIIAELSDNLRFGVIIITGTNGKTTTAKMLAAILQESGLEVIYNFAGSNLSRGIASTLIFNSNLRGTKTRGDIAIFEVDEATMPEITTKVEPRVVLVTNLFRDQLDRYGELDKTAEIIGNSIKNLTNTTVVLNADDPLVANLSTYNPNVAYFGMSHETKSTQSKGAIDSKNCLACGANLNFLTRYFGHLGIYECQKCGFTRPDPTYTLENSKLAVDKSEGYFVGPDIRTKLKINIPGLYNLYNALAAAAVAHVLHVPYGEISRALESVSAAFGRMEKITVGNKNILILLVKNPTGFTQGIETLTYDKKPKNLLLALNDNFADGTDVSWIWDAEIELLRDFMHAAVVSGIRGEDLLLRLKHAEFEIKKIRMEKNISKALELALKVTPDGETLYILPTYTAMLEIRRILANKGLVKGLLE